MPVKAIELVEEYASVKEPLLLCEICESFAVEPGLKFLMDQHRAGCDGKAKMVLRILFEE